MSLGSFVADTLSKHLDKLFQDINRDQLHIHLWRGKVSLSQLKLKTLLWNSLVRSFGFVLQQGTVDFLEFSLFQSHTSLSITLKGLHLKFRQASPEEDQEISRSETIYNESGLMFSAFEWNETLSLLKTELGSFLAALVSLTVEEVTITLEYFVSGQCNQLSLFIDKLQVFEREAGSIPMEGSAEGYIDLGLGLSKMVSLHQLEIYHIQCSHNRQKTIGSLASCRLELDAMIQVQELSISCSIFCSSSLQLDLDCSVIESLWNLMEAFQEYQRSVDKCKSKHSIEESSMIVAQWKWITRFVIVHWVRPIRKYYCIFRSCCFRWLRLQLLQDEFEDYRLSPLQVVFLERMEKRFPQQCMFYLRHLKELAVSTHEQDSLCVFSLLDEEYLKELFTRSCFFQSSSWHPLMSKPTIALKCHWEGGVDVHLRHKNVKLEWQLGNCYLEWLNSEREEKWIVMSRSVGLFISLNNSLSSPMEGFQDVWNIIDSSDRFSSWIQLEYRLEHEEPFSGFLTLELCGIRMSLYSVLFRYFHDMIKHNKQILEEGKKKEKEKDSLVSLIWKMKGTNPFNQLVWNALSSYQPRSSLNWVMERGAILIKVHDLNITCSVSSKEYSKEGLKLSWDTLELQRAGYSIHDQETPSSCSGILSTIDNLCVVHIWNSYENDESQSRTLLCFSHPIELTLSRDEKENMETFQCVIDQLQVSILSQDWLFLWYCLQQDYQLFYLPLEIREATNLPLFKLEWKQMNLVYQSKRNHFSSCSVSLSFLSMELDSHRFVLLQSSHNELYGNRLCLQFTGQGQSSAVLSLQYIYVDLFPALKWMQCISPTSHTQSVQKSSHSLDWIYGQVMIEKLDVAYSHMSCIPFHLLLERIRFTLDKNIEPQETRDEKGSMHEMPWKWIVFSTRLYADRNEYTETLLDMLPFTISMKEQEEYHFKLCCMFSPIHIRLTLEDIESLMNGSIFALQIVNDWMENSIHDNIPSEEPTFLFSSLHIGMEEFCFQWTFWNHEAMISFQRASGGYDTFHWGEEWRTLSTSSSTATSEASMKRFWFRLPNWTAQVKSFSHTLFSFQSQSIFYNVLKSPFEFLQVEELKLGLDTCFFSILTSLVLWWKQQWHSKWNSIFHKSSTVNDQSHSAIGWYRFVIHRTSIGLLSCHSWNITTDWEIHQWMMEFREQIECIIYFQYMASTIGKGPNIWEYQGKPLILSIVPDWNPPDYSHPMFFKNRAIQLSYNRRLSRWNGFIPLNNIQLQLNFPLLQLCLELKTILASMMDRLSLSSQGGMTKKHKDSFWSIHCQVSSFRCCLLECSDVPVVSSSLVVLQGTLKHINLEISSLPELCITFSTRQYKFGLDSMAVDSQGSVDSSLMDGRGESSTDHSRNTSWVSDSSDNRRRFLVTGQNCHASKRHHSLFKGDEIWVKAQPNIQSFSIRIQKWVIQFSAQRYSCLDRWLKSWLPRSESTSQTLTIPHMQLAIVQAKFIWMDQEEWEGLPLCRALLSFQLQCSPFGGRLDVSCLVELYNMIHLALEPVMEEWNTCLYFRKQEPCDGLAFIASSHFPSHPLFSHFDIQLNSSRILQLNLNPPMVATLYRLYNQLQESRQPTGSRALFSICNRTGETIELYQTKDVVIQQIKDGHRVELVDQLVIQGHFYLYSPYLSSPKRVDLAFDETQCYFPIHSSEQGLFLVIEKQISGLNTLLDIRSNYFIQNHCDNVVLLNFLYVDSHQVQSMRIESGERRNVPLDYLCNGKHIRVSFNDMTGACLDQNPLFMDWLQSCFQSNHLSEWKDGFVHCIAQPNREMNQHDVVIAVMPLLCVRNYLGIDVCLMMNDSFSSHWNALPHMGCCMFYSLQQRYFIRTIQTDEQYMLEWDTWSRHKRQTRSIGNNTEGRCISYTVLPSSSYAWKEMILHPDVIVASPRLPIKEQNITIGWQWMEPSNIWLWNDQVDGEYSLSKECFVLTSSLRLTFGTNKEVSSLKFRLTWKVDDANICYDSTIQRCKYGIHVIHWPMAHHHSSESSNIPTHSVSKMPFDNSIVVVVSQQKWMEQDVIIPHVTILPKYILENSCFQTWQLEWREKSYVLEQGSTMMLSEAMVQSHDFIRFATSHSSGEGGDSFQLQFSQVREMASKGLNAIFSMKNSCSYFVQIQLCDDDPCERFKLMLVDCPPTTLRVVNLSRRLFRLCIGKDSLHKQYLLGNGQCVSLQQSFMDMDSIDFYAIQSGKSHLIYRWKDIMRSYSGPVYNRKGWIFYFISRGPYRDMMIMQRGGMAKWENALIHRASFSHSWTHSRAIVNMQGIAISLYSLNNDEIAYTCFNKIKVQCNWTQEGYFWLSFALQDIHIDNQVTTVGKNYAVCMERAMIGIPDKSLAMIQGRLGIWWKEFTRMSVGHLVWSGNGNILDELQCSVQPCAIRLDSDVLESCIWWWIETQEWTKPYPIASYHHPTSSTLSSLTFVEHFHLSDIACQVSFQFGRKGVVGLLHLPWYSSSPFVQWERWIALFGLSVGNIEDAPLWVRSVTLFNIDWSSLIYDVGLFYKRDLLWGIYALMGSLNWFGNPNKCWKKMQFALRQFVTNLWNNEDWRWPILLLREWVKLNYRILDSWIEASLGMLRGTMDWLSSTLAYVSTHDMDQRIWHRGLDWSHRWLVHVICCMEYLQSWLSRWDNDQDSKCQRWRPIRSTSACQPLRAFDYQDQVLGNWIFEHWNGRLDSEQLILFAPLKDQLGMLWTNYRFVFCWYSVSLWKGGTKMSLQHPSFACQWELWHDQVLLIEKKDRCCIAMTCVPNVKPRNCCLSATLSSSGMIQVYEVICQDEAVTHWWLVQLREKLFRCRQSVVYHSTFHSNGHVFPNLSGDW
ncbi:hypothetical protein GpartN1_g4910.t1 [Galdieria partita]|uniref:Uncharacterized protein n=1 Tax=Galdieria partita TaxID=83374 RepID=A0A9C7URL0_9RHOD|nr:hypothetical protein GpartN1_g4910.t1 [Galdieria partita]